MTGAPWGGQWRLARIEVVNWGTFHGHTRIDVARRGHLFTGASGSGKSSLLDAIATALTQPRWLRFNAAAQEAGSRKHDRSFISYVRGAWGKEADEEFDRARHSYLRSNTTWSAVLLRYENQTDPPVTLVRAFHLKGTSSDTSALHDLAFLDRGDIDLLDLKPYVAGGIDVRRVKAAYPSALVTGTGKHGQYWARIATVFGMPSESALHLLHRTQSAKNLGSLDQLFRNFMLDEPATFAAADTAVENFGELNQAHALVVEAREQITALSALEPAIAAYEEAGRDQDDSQRLMEGIRPFRAALTLDLIENEQQTLSIDLAQATSALREAQAAVTLAEHERDEARRLERELGGSEVELIQLALEHAERERTAVTNAWDTFTAELARLGLETPQSREDFEALVSRAAGEIATARAASSTRPAAHEHEDAQRYFTARNDAQQLRDELNELNQRRSNLPPKLLFARRQISEALNIPIDALPFAGELIDVESEFVDWTGAIERVLRSFAMTLLVRDRYQQDVLQFVDSHDLQTRLVIETVGTAVEAPKPVRTARSLLHRIRVAPSEFRDWLQGRLAREFDIECVDSATELQGVDRGLTINGLIKKSIRRYEKNDLTSVSDRRSWILGSDNASKVDLLRARLLDTEERLSSADGRLRDDEQRRQAEAARLAVLEALVRREWATIDQAGAERRVQKQQQRLLDLTQGNADLTDAGELARMAEAELHTANESAAQVRIKLAEVASRREQLETEAARVREELGDQEVDEGTAQALTKRFRANRRKLDRHTIIDVSDDVRDDLLKLNTAAAERSNRAFARYTEAVGDVRRRWPAITADLTSSIADRGGYRQLRAEIESRGLPAHEQAFLNLLRDRSRELIAFLRSELLDAPRLVRERIEPVNDSLRRSPFDRERWLQIHVREQRGLEVRELLEDLKRIVEGSWADEDITSAEERFAVLARVIARLGSSEHKDRLWRDRCLDTREHVTFQGREIDAAGSVLGVHDSSEGLSGGQRQKLVIFCLAAALRYQLAPDERELPSYATVILDEAFDKADSAYTRMAMDVFVEFGFHMILATPQKLLATIEPYVGAVTAISNEDRKQSTIANVNYEVGLSDDGEP
ncbi:ATP-binding protein [Luethyella okanaganae]|uniref:ATP-binding protein n=1 Tax=Luethyella okanaganae TaxID=69372 RepID=A0ABW1VJA2_9MICO